MQFILIFLAVFSTFFSYIVASIALNLNANYEIVLDCYQKTNDSTISYYNQEIDLTSGSTNLTSELFNDFHLIQTSNSKFMLILFNFNSNDSKISSKRVYITSCSINQDFKNILEIKSKNTNNDLANNKVNLMHSIKFEYERLNICYSNSSKRCIKLVDLLMQTEMKRIENQLSYYSTVIDQLFKTVH